MVLSTVKVPFDHEDYNLSDRDAINGSHTVHACDSCDVINLGTSLFYCYYVHYCHAASLILCRISKPNFFIYLEKPEPGPHLSPT
jgi:hypothetical protein